jgi:hypothetical protein
MFSGGLLLNIFNKGLASSSLSTLVFLVYFWCPRLEAHFLGIGVLLVFLASWKFLRLGLRKVSESLVTDLLIVG